MHAETTETWGFLMDLRRGVDTENASKTDGGLNGAHDTYLWIDTELSHYTNP